MSDVTLVDVAKRYGNVEACRGVNMHVADGEFVTLLGPSGCGKSTTLNMIAGLESVTAGDILIDGTRVNGFTPFERDVAMVFQQYALYPHMTVAENIGFPLRLHKRSKAETAERVRDVAGLLELTSLLDRLPRELSGGQQQRVALGRAIIREPRIFLFDEPFSNLDAALRLRMRTEIKLLHARLGVTSIFVTHDQEEALSISDRIAVMRQGIVEQYGTPAEIYAAPASTSVARFIGSPPMDILSGHLERRDGTLHYAVGDAAFPIPAAASASLDPVAAVDLGIRSEYVYLTSPQDGVPATVQVVQPVGPSTVVTTAWSGGSLTARAPGMADIQPGARVGLCLDPAKLIFFDRASGLRVSDSGLQRS